MEEHMSRRDWWRIALLSLGGFFEFYDLLFTGYVARILKAVEDREIRLKFESDTLGGNYEMGRLLITAETGDERP